MNDSDTSRAAELLAEIRQTLQRQLRLAGQNDWAGVAGLMESLSAGLAELDKLPRPLTAELSQPAGQVRRLYDQLQLSLQASRAEISGRLGHTARGRSALRAYRGF